MNKKYKPNALYPITKPQDQLKYGVYDIETNDWINHIVSGYYDEETGFKHFKTVKEFIEFSLTTKVDVIFAHFGGKYDFLFLIDELVKSYKDAELLIIPRASLILNMDITIGDKKLSFWDSSAILPFKLDTITKTFNTEVKKKKINYETITEITKELLEYLEADCVGLHQAIKKLWSWDFIKNSGASLTVASQAVKIFRSMLDVPLFALDKKLDVEIRTSYFGGRTEIFKPFYNNDKKPLNCYDVNSLYPSVMLDNEYPVRFKYYTGKYLKDACGFYDVTVTCPNIYYPLLGYKHVKTHKLIFPTGTFRGVYSIPELNKAIKLGYKIDKIHEGFIFEGKTGLFNDYVNQLYNKRLYSEKGSIDNVLSKLFMNSLYGKFGMNLTKENIVFDDGSEELTPYIQYKNIKLAKKDVELESFNNVAIASYVTSYARLQLYKWIEKAKNVYYCDTDSIFTPNEVESSSKIGDVKLEYQTNYACFLLPKTYITDKSLKLKGFDKEINHFSLEDFEHALKGEMMLQESKTGKGIKSFKQAIKSGVILQKVESQIKRIKSTYDKRIITINDDLNLWDTKPIKLGGKEK